MNLDKIMALSLDKLGLSSTSRNQWVEFVKKQRDPEFHLPYDSRRLKLLKEWAREVSVGELIQLLDQRSHPTPADLRQIDGKLAMKLVELGMTQIDWIALPNSSVTPAMLRRLSKEKLLSLSVLVLGTLSHKVMDELAHRKKKSIRDVTIQELLMLQPFADKWDRNGFPASYSTSFHNTRSKLLDIGFCYKDGVFLQARTRRQLAEDLMTAEGLSKKMAYKFADIARKRNWVPDFIG